MRVLAADRRQQLIEAAIRLMWSQGVERVTLRDIAKEADAPLASVHYCFESKDLLMQAAVEHWLTEFVGNLVEDIPVEGGLRPVVLRIAGAFWDALEANPPNVLAQLEAVLWAVRDRAEHDLARMIYERYAEVVGDVFARALDAKGETSAIEPHVLARTLCAVLDSSSMQYMADPQSPNGHEVFELMLNAVLDRADI